MITRLDQFQHDSREKLKRQFAEVFGLQARQEFDRKERERGLIAGYAARREPNEPPSAA